MYFMSASSLPTYDAPGDGYLTPEILEGFRETGVIVLRDFVSAEDCAALRQRAQQLVDEFDPGEIRSVFSTTDQEQLGDKYFIESGDKIRFFLESNSFDESGRLRQAKAHSLNKIGHALHDLDPEFDRFSRTPKLANLADSLDFDDPVIIQSMYIFKPPRIGGEVVCHQDSTYLYTEPESCVGFWFALEDATLENGCLHFIPGAHRLPLKKRNYRKDDGTITTDTLDDTPWPEERKIAAPAKAGALVVFHGRAPHLSGANLSDKSRHAYTLHAIDRSCHYPGTNWLQRGPGLPLRGFSD